MIVFPTVITDADVCELNWQYFDGSCYKETSASISAHEARNACQVEDADLVKITSSEENSFVNSLIVGQALIGLERDNQLGEFIWKDGMQVSFSQWNGSPGSQSCVVIDDKGDWKTANCFNATTKYVCEKGMSHHSFSFFISLFSCRCTDVIGAQECI